MIDCPGKWEATLMIATVLIGLVALIHIYIVILEMALWTRPAGRKAFGMTAEHAELTRTLAANQGLYNGFLVAGLAWGLWLGAEGFPVKVFFIACVLVAGLYGGVTVSRKILLIQALPAVLALTALALGF
jgi:putative membrane protein